MKKSISVFLLILALVISCITPAFAVLRGDVDGTPGISSSDARLVLRAATGLEALTAEQAASADVDETEGITASDARLILRAAVGLEDLGELEGVHVHSYTKKEITNEPSCTTPGTQKLICICGKELTETLDALGHDYQLTKEEAPTCKKQGKQVFTCTHCLNPITQFTEKLEHDYQIKEEKPAECETRGHIGYQCKNCTSVKTEQFPATGHSYNADTGLCANCGNSDPEHYDIIPAGEKWIIEDNWEISIESVVNHPHHSDSEKHPHHSSSENHSQEHTNQQSVLIRYEVKSLGYTSNLTNSTELIISSLDFGVYDENGMQATNYNCNHTDVAQVSANGLSDAGMIHAVLHNTSKTITFIINEFDSDGVMRRAKFTANVMD